jgi:hypothetical protein
MTIMAGTTPIVDVGGMQRASIATITISADTTLTTDAGDVGAAITLVITTSGTSSRTVTFGSGFKSTGTLSTGTVNGKKFVVSFIFDGATWTERSRTTAM